MPQISTEEFERLPLRVHAFLAGVPLHDVWAIDLPRPRSGITLDELLRRAGAGLFSPSPVVRMNRAVALRWVAGSTAALAELESLAAPLDGYHLFHAARAELLHELGRREEARAAEERALGLTANRAERALLERRLKLSPGAGA